MRGLTKYAVGRKFRARKYPTCEFTVHEGIKCDLPADRLSPRTNNYLCFRHFRELEDCGMFDIEYATGRFESS